MGKSMKASEVTLRLVLLTLLLLGVGVLHTLGHAGAHGGITASDAVQHLDNAAPVAAGSPHATDETTCSLADTVEFLDPHQHVETTVHTDVSSCFAVVSPGPWLVPPHSHVVWDGDDDIGAGPSGSARSSAMAKAGSRLQVLRI
ncbi:hypothetical protein [Streptomyces regalis]|uniref:Uncharacterized protein n=1 Tax=Streptomyces regalis TaxID=68262 RepID=A0A0X3VQP3_9ACTN|nr:hypothetical protein [Streptomyces regalis]KUL46990.1 hypothetical protein ADL12_00670 [Streptomyces regalis]